jgi:hypothetical protein
MGVLAGTAAPGSTVRIYDGEVLIGETIADANGNWSFRPRLLLTPGEHTLTAKVTDATGAESGASQPMVITVAPQVAAGTNASGVTGAVVTSPDNNRPVLRGTAPPGTLIRVYDGDKFLGSVRAGPKGNWTFVVKKSLTPGQKTLRIATIGPNGRRIAIDIPVSIAAEARRILAPSLQLPRKHVLHQGQRVFGAGEPGTWVEVYDDGQLVGVAKVKANGSWSLLLPVTLPSGARLYTLVMVDQAGNVLSLSAPISVRLDGSKPPRTLPVTGGALTN